MGEVTTGGDGAELNGKAKGALTVEAKVGAKAQLGIPKSVLPAGWDPLDIGVQYEYKPGGEWEIFVLDWDDGEINWSEGKDMVALKQAIEDFVESAKNAPSAMRDAVSDHLGGIDPFPNRDHGEGTEGAGLFLGGRNLE